MEVVYAPSFLRLLKKLDPPIKKSVIETVEAVIDYYETGDRTPGLGVTHLRGDKWEARAGIKRRVIYAVGNNRLTFILAGASHDEVRNFLKTI